MSRLLVFGLMFLLLVGCGSEPSAEEPPQAGVLLQGSVNVGSVPFAIMEWATTDGVFKKSGFADSNGKWSVSVPLADLNHDQGLIIMAVNPINQQKVRSVAATNDLLANPGPLSSNLTTVSQYTEAAFQLLRFAAGYDQAKMDIMQSWISVVIAGNPVTTGGAMLDHFALAVQKQFANPNSIPGQGVAPKRDPLWQVWCDESQADITAMRADCSACHPPDFCIICHAAGAVYSPERFKKAAMIGAHWSGFHLGHPISDRSQFNHCASCHENTLCINCHAGIAAGDLMDIPHRQGWSNPVSGTPHFLFNTSQCQACHPGSVLPSTLWSNVHAQEARQNLSTCQVCHPGADICLTCHSTQSGLLVNPHPVDWNTRKDTVDSTACATCH